MTEQDQTNTSFRAPRFWGVWLGLGVLRLLHALPIRWQFSLGRMLGKLSYRVATKRRRITQVNLQLCFPEKSAEEKDQICRQHFEDLGVSLFEMMQAWWAPDSFFERIVDFDGLDNLKAAQESKDGLIIITGHFSTLEISGRFLRLQVPQFDAIYRAHRNPLLDQKIRQGRQRSARALIEKSDIRTMVRSLRNGIAVWYAPDQSYRKKYAELLDFFGVPAMTNTATGRLAALGKAAVVPFYCARIPGTLRYKVRFEPALDSDSMDDKQLTEAFINSLEKATREHPSQYFWVHRKFKERPAPLPDVYARKAPDA